MIIKLFKSLLRNFKTTSSLLDLFFVKKFYLVEKGWVRSRMSHRPVTKEGDSLPWFTYSSIEFVEQRLKPTFKVYEFGSGNSTLFFSKRVNSINSVESDHGFFEELRPKLDPVSNVTYSYFPDEEGAFGDSIKPFSKTFDVIVVDGADRVNCARNSIAALKDDGVIIWDNSDRLEYQEGYDFLLNNGFKRIDFVGHGPIGYKEWATSIFYRKDNCFDI